MSVEDFYLYLSILNTLLNIALILWNLKNSNNKGLKKILIT